MKDPIIIRQRLTTIDWEIDQLTTERSTLEAELARVGLKAVPYQNTEEKEARTKFPPAPNEATLEEIVKGGWHFKNPTLEARKVFEDLGVPLERDESYWREDYYEYAEWFGNKAYTSNFLERCNEGRELIILNGKLHFAAD